MPVGTLFFWKGRHWRRGVGILYAAKPLASGIVFEAFQRRYKKRERRDAAQYRRLKVTTW